MNADETKANEEAFIALLKSTEREGVDDLIDYLKNNNFFTAPCSTVYHLNVIGGLCKHSLNVYHTLCKLCESLVALKPSAEPFYHNSIIIIALLHDVCKANSYIWSSSQNKWLFNVDDFPFGHGEKSAFIVNKFISLADDEALAIRWHMNFFSAGTLNGVDRALDNAIKASPLVLLVFLADYFASNILED